MVNIGGSFHTRSMFFLFFFDMWQLVCSIFQNTSENWADVDGLLVRNEETISYILYCKRLCTILHNIQLKNCFTQFLRQFSLEDVKSLKLLWSSSKYDSVDQKYSKCWVWIFAKTRKQVMSVVDGLFGWVIHRTFLKEECGSVPREFLRLICF